MGRDYSLGKIYEVVNSVTHEKYLGSTAMKYLCQRMGPHRACAAKNSPNPLYQAMRQYGVEKFKIELVKNFPCMTRKELEKEEYRLIDEYVKQGVKLYNVKLKAGGPMPEATKKAISRAKLGVATKYGCLNYSNGRWSFIWRDQGRNCSKAFSVGRWGYLVAKKKAEAVRHSVYPAWVPNEEEHFTEALLLMEW
jgi:hypothetical protein